MVGPYSDPHPADHPWLDGRFSPVPSLEPHLRVWALLAAHVAAGDLPGVARDWSYLDRARQRGGLEVILQTHLFAGYPRAINALAAVHEQGVAEGIVPDVPDYEGDWLQEGERLCARIYGPGYPALRRRMVNLHPAIDRWMVATGYGRVLSRPGLTTRERELCAVAVLAGQNVAPQLESHLRGAVRVGATPPECRGILDHTQAVFGEPAQQQVNRVWQAVGGQLDLLHRDPWRG